MNLIFYADFREGEPRVIRLFLRLLAGAHMDDGVGKMLLNLICLVTLFKVGDLLGDLLQDFADIVGANGGHSLLVEVDVLVQQLHVELDFGTGIHALGGDLGSLLQAVVDPFLVAKLQVGAQLVTQLPLSLIT